MLEQGQRLPVDLAQTGIQQGPVLVWSISYVLRYIEFNGTFLFSLSYVPVGRARLSGAVCILAGVQAGRRAWRESRGRWCDALANDDRAKLGQPLQPVLARR